MADTSAEPSLSTQSCQPWGRGPDENSEVGWSCGSLQDHPAVFTAQGLWGGCVMGRVVVGGHVGLVFPTCSPLPPSCRGASRTLTATCPTPDPAPATTMWQPWPPRPLWVGASCPLLPVEFALSTSDTSFRGRGQGCIAAGRIVASPFSQCQAPSWVLRGVETQDSRPHALDGWGLQK